MKDQEHNAIQRLIHSALDTCEFSTCFSLRRKYYLFFAESMFFHLKVSMYCLLELSKPHVFVTE